MLWLLVFAAFCRAHTLVYDSFIQPYNYNSHLSHQVSIIYKVKKVSDGGRLDPDQQDLKFSMNASVPLVNLDSIGGIREIKCQGNRVVLYFDDDHRLSQVLEWDAEARETGILALIHPKNKCNGEEKVHFKLVKSIVKLKSTIVMETSIADLSKVGSHYSFEFDSGLNLANSKETKKHFNWTSHMSLYPFGEDSLLIKCIECRASGFFSPKIAIKGLFRDYSKPSVDLNYVGELDSLMNLQFDVNMLPPAIAFNYNILHLPIWGLYIPGLIGLGPSFKLELKFRVYMGPRTKINTGFSLKVPPFETFLQHRVAGLNLTHRMSPEFKFLPFKLESLSTEVKGYLRLEPMFAVGLTAFEHLNFDLGVGVSNGLYSLIELVKSEDCEGAHVRVAAYSDLIAVAGLAQLNIKRFAEKKIYEKCSQLSSSS